MKRLSKLSVTLLVGLAFAASRAAAQTPDPNTVLLRATGDAKEYQNANVVVVYDSTDVDVKETGLSYVLIHRLTKILTSAGAKEYRRVAFGYDPLSAMVEIRLARIYHKDGTVETVPAGRTCDYPAPARAIYWGAREKMVEFGRLEPGDAVETIIFRKGFTYALLAGEEGDDKYIPPMRGEFYDIVEFWSSVPVKEKVYRVAVPKEKVLQYEFYNGEATSFVHFSPDDEKRVEVLTNADRVAPRLIASAPEKQTGGKTIYCWSKRDITPFRQEPGMVAPSDVAPKLLVSTTRDWYAKSRWFHNVNEEYGSFAVTPEVKKKADGLLAGVTDEMEKISILTHWVAEEVRYSGISMGPGEGYTLHKGSMTYLDRCGVCKDKAGMLITMLRAAGFQSYPAMTMAGSRIDRIPADQFNHSVTVVKLSSGQWMLLDPTWVPGVRELWSSAEQQQEFLMGILGGADLMTTPVSPAEKHYWKLNGVSTLTEDGTLEGSLTVVAEGQSDAAIRRAFTRNFISGWEEYIPRVMNDISPKAEILAQKFSDPVDLSTPMTLTITYRIPGYATVTNDRILFTPLLARNPFGDRIMSPEMYTDTSLASRLYGFRMRCSKLTQIHETVTLPQYGKALLIPRFAEVKGPCAGFTAAYEVEGTTLRLSAVHRMEKRVYKPEEWPGFRRALIERMKLTDSPLVLAK